MREDHPVYGMRMDITDQDIEKARTQMLTLFAAITAMRGGDLELMNIIGELTADREVAGISIIQLIGFLIMGVRPEVLDAFLQEGSAEIALTPQETVRDIASRMIKGVGDVKD